MLSVEDKQLRARFAICWFGSAEKDGGERRVGRVTAKKKQGTGEVAADDRSHEIGHLFACPDEVTLEVRQTDLALVSLFHETDDFCACPGMISTAKILTAAPPIKALLEGIPCS